ncbi:MAG: T3SS effector HopA1 family protein [Cytophagales bacterium]|nr:T3SS effector HopA1 family protein [Cytophagales bacterium]
MQAVIQSSGAPIQAKFRVAYSNKTHIAHAVGPNANKTELVFAKTLFLHEKDHEFSSGEQLIGLPNGMYRIPGPVEEEKSPPSFHQLLDWLYELWSEYRERLLCEEELRLNLHLQLYNITTDKTASYVYTLKKFQNLLQIALSGYPRHLMGLWQWGQSGIFSLSKLRWRTTVKEASESAFLHIFNDLKGRGKNLKLYYRIYINVAPYFFPEILQFVINNIILDETFPFTYFFKIANVHEISRRKDNLVIFSDSAKERARILLMLAAFQEDYSFAFDKEVPMMSDKQMTGVSIAESPIMNYMPMEEGVSFDYSREIAEELMRQVQDDPFLINYRKDEEVKSILESMQKKADKTLLPHNRAEAISLKELEKLQQKYLQYTGNVSEQIEDLRLSVYHTTAMGAFLAHGNTSFLELRTHLIVRALLDSILQTADPNVFICQVWKLFQQARINFFKPHENLPARTTE